MGKQGQTYGNPVADGWAGAVMRHHLETNNVTDQPTYRLTYRHGEV